MRLAVVLLCLLALAYPGLSQWGGGGCFAAPAMGPVGPALPAFQPATFAPTFAPLPPPPAWVRHATDSGCWVLTEGSRPLGYLDAQGTYRPCVGADYGPACEPPIPRPSGAVPPAPPADPQTPAVGDLPRWMTAGVDSSQLSGREVCKVDGREVSKREMYQAVHPNAGSGELIDDSQKAHLTVIGPADKTAPVVQDLAQSPDLAEFRGKVLVQVYDPSKSPDRDMLDCGFVMSGQPTIYLSDAAGKVLHRQDDYSGGAGMLASALRRRLPDYDPAKDPDARKASPLPGIDLDALKQYWWVGAIAALLALMVWRRRQDNVVK